MKEIMEEYGGVITAAISLVTVQLAFPAIIQCFNMVCELFLAGTAGI